MPKIDGLELLARIRKSGNGIKKTPVVIVSTSDNPQLILQSRELGCIAYIVKPIGQDKALEDAVNNACLTI